MTLGLVCDQCDALSPATAAACVRCGAGLIAVADAAPVVVDLAATPAVAQVYEIEAAPEGTPPPPAYDPDLATTLLDPPAASWSPLEAIYDEPTGAVDKARHCPYCGAPTLANHKF